MLYLLFSNLVEQFSFLNVFKYLTVRTGLSMFTAMLVVFLVGNPLINLFSCDLVMNIEILLPNIRISTEKSNCSTVKIRDWH